jgi:replication factor C subunit 1
MLNISEEKLWINKYIPKRLQDIIGNTNQINKFNKWLNEYSNNKSKSIIISGSQGLGKKLTIQLLLESTGYIVKIINPNEIKDHRNYDDFNDYYNFVNSIYNKIKICNGEKNNSKKKLALIFNKIENITLMGEKKYIMDIYKYNNKIKAFPLIFISNNHHSKLLNDLKKGCDEIIFKIPDISDIQMLIKKISINENVFFENNNIINQLIEFSQFDIKRLINLFQELSYHSVNRMITQNIMNNFIDKSREKNIDLGLFESTEKIINNYLDYEYIMRLYESEKVLLPLMIHENYLKKIPKVSNNSKDNLIYNIVKITDSISRGDNIETSIYTDQNWYLQNIHGFFSCLNTSFWINNSKSGINYNILEDKDIKFSADLNKTSLKNINRKNIINLSKIINNKSNQEILILNKICNSLINTNENELIKILQGYNKDINIKDIELCLKIDKTTEYKTLASKDKKRIIKQINI